ncbi:unnamed protein product [Triticum aestivum]|uniref:Uncharacterized protein n=1 Tax=Triticum aestivum TaxID=4565 RepID=A0A7H4LKH4_WHEAT|nr:unnamed protein product [Triticum aestivum]
MGEGSNRAYVDGHKVWYDSLDKLTCSPIMVEHLVEEIGWEMAGRLKAYYQIPILDITQNSLRHIRSEADTDQMMMFLSIGHHFFSIYLDHDDSLITKKVVDDVVKFPRAELPPVFSPSKDGTNPHSSKPGNSEEDCPIPIQVVYPNNVPHEDGNPFMFVRRQCTFGEGAEENAEQQGQAGQHDDVQQHEDAEHRCFEGNVGIDSDSDDSDFDPGDMVDSDFEISDDDDGDLYADNVDEDEPVQRKEKVKQKTTAKDKGVVGEENMSDYESEGEDLWAPDSDDEMQTKFRAFRKEDLTCPKFHVVQVLENVDLLRKAIKEYSCKNRVDVKLPVNDRKRTSPETGTLVEDLMVDHMLQQRPLPRVLRHTPIPESTFLTNAQAMLNQAQTSTNTIRQGELAKKMLAMKQQRKKELQDRKQAILEARIEAELKKAEEAARRRHEKAEKKAIEAEKKREAATQKKETMAILRQARAETRQIIVETQRELSAERKEKLGAERKAQKEAAPAKKLEEKKAIAAQKESERQALLAKKHEEKQALAAKKQAERQSLAAKKEQLRKQAQRNMEEAGHVPERSSMFDIFR